MYIIVWQTRNNLYYKVVKGTYKKYYIGYENQYSHKIIFIIDLYHDLNIFYKKRFSFKMFIIKHLRDLLNILERR